MYRNQGHEILISADFNSGNKKKIQWEPDLGREEAGGEQPYGTKLDALSFPNFFKC